MYTVGANLLSQNRQNVDILTLNNAPC